MRGGGGGGAATRRIARQQPNGGLRFAHPPYGFVFYPVSSGGNSNRRCIREKPRNSNAPSSHNGRSTASANASERIRWRSSSRHSRSMRLVRFTSGPNPGESSRQPEPVVP